VGVIGWGELLSRFSGVRLWEWAVITLQTLQERKSRS